MEFLETISELPAGDFLTPETPSRINYLESELLGVGQTVVVAARGPDLAHTGCRAVFPSLPFECPQWPVRAAAGQ